MPPKQPKLLEIFRKGLSTLKIQVQERRQSLLKALVRREKISAADEEWLDGQGNTVDEEKLLDELEKSSNCKKAVEELGAREKGLLKTLQELAGSVIVPLPTNKRKHE